MTEHQTDPTVTPNGKGTTTGKQIGFFQDILGQPIGGPDASSTQTFTIGSSPAGSGSQTRVPIMWHDNDRRRSNNISVHNGRATVNGMPFPQNVCGGGGGAAGTGGSGGGAGTGVPFPPLHGGPVRYHGGAF